MSFSDDLKAAKTADVPFEDVAVLLNGHAHTLRFRQMNGFDWQLQVDLNPVRPNVAVDATTGYNVRTLVRAVAPLSGVVLEDGKETNLRVDPADAEDRVDEWADLLDAINGHDFGAVSDAIWRLNDAAPQLALAKAVEQVKKARTRSSKTSD